MKPKWVLLLLALGVLAFLLACTPPDAPCAPSALGAPGNLSPANKQIVPLTPTLHWEYPSSVPSPYPYPAGATGCGFTGFQIHLISSVDLTIEHGGTVGASTMSFSPSSPLAPATLYFWEVRVLTAGGHGPWSGFRAFFTGPVCDTSSLVAPILYSPEGTIHNLLPLFQWYYPNTTCVPEGYRIDLSTDAGFSDTSLSGGTGNPSTSWYPAHDLTDCTTYHWRVAAINGTTLGPFSDPKTFTINMGTSCPTATPVPTLVLPTLVPYEIPHFIPDLYANCRLGSGQLYGLVTSVPAGVQTEALGRHQTQDGWWYFVKLPDGKQCWMFERSGKLEGDPNLIPLLLPPPLPTQPPSGGGDEGGGGGVCTLNPVTCRNQKLNFDSATCSCVPY